ncbi:MAG: DUF3237 domain-containing protein [Desulfomonilaceae bacterium]
MGKQSLTIIMVLLALVVSGMTHAQPTTAADTGGKEPPKPKLEYMSRFSVDLVAPIWELGKTSDLGKRRIIPITGGKFEGPLLNGEIMNNGADWQIVTDDGLAIIDTRYLLKTNDGAYIMLQTKGFRYGPPEVMARVAKGETVDPNEYFFRLYMQFETSAPKYSWLNRAMAIGMAMRLGNAVVYDAYLIK